MKICTKCGEEKPLESFFKRKDSASGYRSQCSECTNAKTLDKYHNRGGKELQKKRAFKALMKSYGLTPEGYDEEREKQNYKCKICGASESIQHHKRLHVDHCHTTGMFRGLLCNRCNTGIGHFKDDVELLKEAIRYLDENSSRLRNGLEA